MEFGFSNTWFTNKIIHHLCSKKWLRKSKIHQKKLTIFFEICIIFNFSYFSSYILVAVNTENRHSVAAAIGGVSVEMGTSEPLHCPLNCEAKKVAAHAPIRIIIGWLEYWILSLSVCLFLSAGATPPTGTTTVHIGQCGDSPAVCPYFKLGYRCCCGGGAATSKQNAVRVRATAASFRWSLGRSRCIALISKQKWYYVSLGSP